MDTTSPGRSSSVCKVIHLLSLKHWIGYGVTAIVLNSVRVLKRYEGTFSARDGEEELY